MNKQAKNDLFRRHKPISTGGNARNPNMMDLPGLRSNNGRAMVKGILSSVEDGLK